MPDDRFLALVIERPDDPDVRMVYADWLEEIGDLARATFLRDQHALFHSSPDDDELLDRGTRLRALGETLAADWIAHVSFPPLGGTVWTGRDSMKKRLVLRFLVSGRLSYTQDDITRTFENGTWRQIGNVAIAETNNHYADYEGVVTGDTLRGASRNVVNFSWRWDLERTTDPDLVEPRGTVIKTVHDNHRGARRAAKPRRRRLARKPVKAAVKEPVKKPAVKKPAVKKAAVKKAAVKKPAPKKAAAKKAAPKRTTPNRR